MNRKEQRRLVVLNRVEAGKMVGREAAQGLGLCLRQVRRLMAAYRKEGAAALAHGNRGRWGASIISTTHNERVLWINIHHPEGSEARS